MTFLGKVTGTLFIWRRSALGDVLWLEPVLDHLSNKYKRIIFYSDYPELFENYPNHNVQFKKSPKGFLRIFFKAEAFLHSKLVLLNLNDAYEKFPAMHFLNGYFKSLGISQYQLRYPKLYLTNAELNKFNNIGKFIVIAIETTDPQNYRQVYGVRWNNVVKYFHTQGFQVFITGKKIKDTFGAVHIDTSIRELIALINAAKLFIGIDSGPSHVAAALRVPAIFFFGSVNPAYRHFLNQLNGIILQGECEYAGCYHKGKTSQKRICKLVGQSGEPKCCVQTTDTVLKAVESILSKQHI